jgi:hypothetical protein
MKKNILIILSISLVILLFTSLTFLVIDKTENQILEIYTTENIYFVEGLTVTNENTPEKMIFSSFKDLQYFIGTRTAKETSLNILHVENVDEMESTPPELYIFIGESKYLLYTESGIVEKIY